MDPNEVIHLLGEAEDGDEELVITSTHATEKSLGLIPVKNASNLITNFKIVSATRANSTDSRFDDTPPNKWSRRNPVYGRSKSSNTSVKPSSSQLEQSEIHTLSETGSEDSQPERISLDDSEDSVVSLSAKSSPQLIVSDGDDVGKSGRKQVKEKRSRKSQHVVRANCESPTFEFGDDTGKPEEMATEFASSPEEDVTPSQETAPTGATNENAATDNPNEVLMKKLAFLRTATNFLLKETGRKQFMFKHKLDTINFVDLYREIDCEKH